MATTTKKRKVGRPRKDQPAPNPYIELEEVDTMLNSITAAIDKAKEARDSVYEASSFILEQNAEPYTAEALMLYQNKQEMYFARIHADGVVDSLECMKSRFTNMHKLFTMETELRKAMEDEILQTQKK